jgi:iron complex outermembrane recepter protein
VPFTFLPSPFDGFGVVTNFTYIDAGKLAVTEGAPPVPVPGVSKRSYNLSGYYEKYGFGARVSYTYRSSYVVDAASYFGDGQYNRPYGQLDASLSYDISRNFSVSLDATNINKAAVQSYDIYGVGRGFENIGRRFTGGVHAKF